MLEMRDYGIFGVAHALGEIADGNEAGKAVIDSIQERCSGVSLDNEIKVMAVINEAIVRAKVKIKQLARKKGTEGVGATVAILRLNPINGSAYIVHAGDSRVYRLRNETLVQLTRDHVSYDDVKNGETGKAEHTKYKLTRAIGLYERTNIETTTIELQPNDIFLLCSNGLYKRLDETQIARVLNSSVAKGIKYAGAELIRETKQSDAEDGLSFVLVKAISTKTPKEQPKHRKHLDIKWGIGLIVLLSFIGLWFLSSRNETTDAEGQFAPTREVRDTSERRRSKVKPVGERKSKGPEAQGKLASRQGRFSSKENTKSSAGDNETGTTQSEKVQRIEGRISEAEIDRPLSTASTGGREKDSAISELVVSELTTKERYPEESVVTLSQEPSKFETQPIQMFQNLVQENGFAKALEECVNGWSIISDDVRHKLSVLILKELNQQCSEAKHNGYNSGDKVRTYFEKSLSIEDSRLQRVITQRHSLFESDFSSVLTETIEQAQASCDWAGVRQILSGNQRMSSELLDSDPVTYAYAWSRFTDLLEIRKPEHIEHIRNLINVSRRIQPFSEINESLTMDIKVFSDSEIVSSQEYCKQISLFSGKIRENLINSAKRLELNLSILNLNNLELLIKSTYVDEKTRSDKMAKLAVFKTTAERLATAQNRLSRDEGWIPPDIELAEFDNWSQEILTMATDAQYCLQFVWVVLRDYQQVPVQSRKGLFKDSTIVADYATELKKIESIFSSEAAKSLSNRFQIIFHPN